MSGNPNFPLSTAVVSWTDSAGQVHLRVYSSDGYHVIERCNDGNGWVTGQFTAPGSQVSATAWYAADGAHLRVFCTIEDTTTEWCGDPETGWTKGIYSPT